MAKGPLGLVSRTILLDPVLCTMAPKRFLNLRKDRVGREAFFFEYFCSPLKSVLVDGQEQFLAWSVRFPVSCDCTQGFIIAGHGRIGFNTKNKERKSCNGIQQIIGKCVLDDDGVVDGRNKTS
jgi:hypothetical protein